jgi:hypothetical protein
MMGNGRHDRRMASNDGLDFSGEMIGFLDAFDPAGRRSFRRVENSFRNGEVSYHG